MMVDSTNKARAPISRSAEDAVPSFLREALGVANYRKLSPAKISNAVEKIEKAISKFRLDRLENAKSSPSELSRQLQSISSSADRLLKALGVMPPRKITGIRPKVTIPPRISSEIHKILVGDSGEWVKWRQLAGSIEQLKARVDVAAAVAQQSVKRGNHNNHAGDSSLNKFIMSISIVWIGLGLKVGVSANAITGQPSGPFFRFVCLCVHHVGVKQTPTALAKRLKVLTKSIQEKIDPSI